MAGEFSDTKAFARAVRERGPGRSEGAIPPTDNAEAAIMLVLAPGNYTAIVGGVNNTTGVAIVEVYGLQ